jgi:hypothetical protein
MIKLCGITFALALAVGFWFDVQVPGLRLSSDGKSEYKKCENVD